MPRFSSTTFLTLSAFLRCAPRLLSLLILIGVLWIGQPRAVLAQAAAIDTICPAVGVQERGGSFQPGGLILTSFDRDALWIYNIDNQRRYPLPETSPCTRNCRLSPDARWLTYFNDLTNAFNKMRTDGTQRTFVTDYAADVQWWSDRIFLIWTPGHQAYLQEEGGTDRRYLDVSGVIAVQPGGLWALMVQQNGDSFERALIDLERRGLVGISDGRVHLGADQGYFNAHAWSPDGRFLAYVAPVDPDAEIVSGEIFGIQPGDSAPAQWTDLAAAYGPVRINGLAVGDLSWSPDSARIAFWVTEVRGPDNLGAAMLHVLDVAAGTVRAYCGYTTTRHTPNPPRLIWSPDGTHVAFAGDMADDDRGHLVLALNTESGVFTVLSTGVYPALGTPNLVAWGRSPQ
ncbi:MAG: hypothetical protein GYB67_00870 [Chloroflexi bacterium]|nr:hypothetical protein [Chloroflexota bacterium]